MRSLIPHIQELSYLIFDNYDIVSLSESWLDGSDRVDHTGYSDSRAIILNFIIQSEKINMTSVVDYGISEHFLASCSVWRISTIDLDILPPEVAKFVRREYLTLKITQTTPMYNLGCEPANSRLVSKVFATTLAWLVLWKNTFNHYYVVIITSGSLAIILSL